MNAVMGFFVSLVSLDKTVLVPIILFIFALIAKTKFSVAFKSALTFGAGLWALITVNNVIVETMTPVAAGLVNVTGSTNVATDLGMSAMFVGVTSLPIFIFIYPIGVAVNLILLKLKFTKTFIIDFLNFFTLLIPAIPVYFMTGNLPLVLLVVVLFEAVVLKCADWLYPEVYEYYGVEGVSISHATGGAQAVIAKPLNWILDHIPGINKIDFSIGDLKNKFGVFGDPAVLGFLLGIVMSLVAGLGLSGALTVGMVMVGAMLIYPKAIGLMMEGLQPISQAMRAFATKLFKTDDCYMGMDAAIFSGYPDTIALTTLFFPIAILLHFALPGCTVIPTGESLTLQYVVFGMLLPICGSKEKKGNAFRVLVIATVLTILGLYIETWAAPLITQLCANAGIVSEGMQVTSFGFRDWQCGLVYALVKLFVH